MTIHHDFNRVLTITPAEVIAHFENSPILAEMASDVRTVLEKANLGQIMAYPGQLEQDLERVFHLGPTARLVDISEALTGSRQYGGATYHRVKAVAAALKNNTTTAQAGGYQAVEVKKAA